MQAYTTPEGVLQWAQTHPRHQIPVGCDTEWDNRQPVRPHGRVEARLCTSSLKKTDGAIPSQAADR